MTFLFCSCCKKEVNHYHHTYNYIVDFTFYKANVKTEEYICTECGRRHEIYTQDIERLDDIN